MPPNTVKVDRTTTWGNPFVVGKHGTRAECVYWFRIIACGALVLGWPKEPDGQWHSDKQQAYVKHLRANLRTLRGKNLACWCPLGAPCHADALLEMANR